MSDLTSQPPAGPRYTARQSSHPIGPLGWEVFDADHPGDINRGAILSWHINDADAKRTAAALNRDEVGRAAKARRDRIINDLAQEIAP